MADHHYSHIVGSWTLGPLSEPRAEAHCSSSSSGESFRPAPLEVRLQSAEVTESMAAVLELALQARRRRTPLSSADRWFASRSAPAKTPEP